jgi:hypothetical protein
VAGACRPWDGPLPIPKLPPSLATVLKIALFISPTVQQHISNDFFGEISFSEEASLLLCLFLFFHHVQLQIKNGKGSSFFFFPFTYGATMRKKHLYYKNK